ncbi:hypothetical protein CRE_14727 [Caenorhabditis remanei]|uniref:Uncharacterized protein n=1 Tax=Caenorhabditis remanei TaxID=31234 RepID=E3M9S5_CAERE|nr:hypothetical protein CRE_14727 [Caenorhabditis remanei]
MRNKQLTYPSLQVILQYMEANKRIHLSHSAPALRTAERCVHLSIDSLSITPCCIQINSLAYAVGLIRHGSLPVGAQEMNKFGGSAYDITEFGEIDHSVDSLLSPGDVVLKDVEADEEDEEMTTVEVDELLRGEEKRLKILKNKKWNEKRQEEIDEIEHLIFAWKNRRDNKKPDYTCYLKMSIVSVSDVKRVEYMEYNKKLYEGIKYLATKILSHRYPIQVNILNIYTEGGVLRLPPTMRLKPRKITMGCNFNENWESLEKILPDPMEGGLNELKLIVTSKFDKPENNCHSVVTTAKSLILEFDEDSDSLTYFDGTIMRSKNQSVYVTNGYPTRGQLTMLIDKILEDKREIGTRFTFGVHNKKMLLKLMSAMRERKNAIRGGYFDWR